MAGLWCASLGFNNERLAAAASAAIWRARLLSHLLQPHPRAGDRPRREARRADRHDRRQGLFRDLGLGSQRDDGEARLGLSHGPRQADQAQGHRPRPRLPRLDHRRCLDVRSRLSCTANSACRCRASCTRSAPIPIAACSRAKTRTQFVDRLAAELEKLILREGPDTIAAFIAEPINAGGGIIVPPQDLFRQDPGGAATSTTSSASPTRSSAASAAPATGSARRRSACSPT